MKKTGDEKSRDTVPFNTSMAFTNARWVSNTKNITIPIKLNKFVLLIYKFKKQTQMLLHTQFQQLKFLTLDPESIAEFIFLTLFYCHTYERQGMSFSNHSCPSSRRSSMGYDGSKMAVFPQITICTRAIKSGMQLQRGANLYARCCSACISLAKSIRAQLQVFCNRR